MLTDKQIEYLLSQGKLIIEPFEQERLGPVSYDLTTIQESQNRGIRRLVTKETLRLPKDIAGIVCPRSRIALKGLFYSASLLVDPGYSGKLIFLVWCPEELNKDIPVNDLFQIIFFKIGKVDVSYDKRESSTAMGRQGFEEVKEKKQVDEKGSEL